MQWMERLLTFSTIILLLSSADVTTLTVKRLASHDLTGSTLDRHLQSKERALVVEREIQNVTVAPGDRAVLNCRIQQLGTKTVRRIFTAVACSLFRCAHSHVPVTVYPRALAPFHNFESVVCCLK